MHALGISRLTLYGRSVLQPDVCVRLTCTQKINRNLSISCRNPTIEEPIRKRKFWAFTSNNRRKNPTLVRRDTARRIWASAKQKFSVNLSTIFFSLERLSRQKFVSSFSHGGAESLENIWRWSDSLEGNDNCLNLLDEKVIFFKGSMATTLYFTSFHCVRFCDGSLSSSAQELSNKALIVKIEQRRVELWHKIAWFLAILHI